MTKIKIFETIKESLCLLSSNYKRCIANCKYLLVFFAGYSFVLAFLFYSNGFLLSDLMEMSANEAAQILSPGLHALLALVSFFSIFLIFLLHLVLIRTYALPDPIGSVTTNFLVYFWVSLKLIGLSILMILIVIVALIPIIMIGTYMIQNVSVLDNLFKVLFFTGLIMVLILINSLAIATVPAALKGVNASIKAAYYIMKGNIIRFFLVILALNIAARIISYVIMYTSQLFEYIHPFVGEIGFIFSFLLAVFIQGMFYCAGFVTVFNKMNPENTDKLSGQATE